MIKKIVIAFGALFGLLLLALLIVPFVVDVDKYRPTIVSKANEQINGKLELGHLGLTLWGKLKISINGMKLSDSVGHELVSVKDVSLDLPWLSILSGSPEIRFHLVKPEINIVKSQNGKLNVMSLMKPAAAPTQPTAQPQSQAGKVATAAGIAIPSIVLNARYTLLLDHANVSYKDELTGEVYKIQDLNFKLKDVSPTSTMPFELTAGLDLFIQKQIKIAGKMNLNGTVKAGQSNGSFESVDAKAAVSLADVEISYPGIFNKAKGVPLGATLHAMVGKDRLQVSEMKFQLADVTFDGSASAQTVGNVTSINFKTQSSHIDIAGLGKLSPLVQTYGLNGTCDLTAQASGPTNKLNYAAKVNLNHVILKPDYFKESLQVDGNVEVVTDQIKDLGVKLTAKSFDAKLGGMLQSFSHPRFKFTLSSSNMDLDELLKASAKAAETRKEVAKATTAVSNPPTMNSNQAGGVSHQSTLAAPVVDYNAMFAPLRQNPVTATASGTIDFDLKRFKSTGIVMNDIKGELVLNHLLLALNHFSMQIFDGTINGNMSFDAKAEKPFVGTNITVSKLQTKKMLESQVPFARNTVKGAISASLNIGGAGLNPTDVTSRWKGKGNLEIKDAIFSTLDIGKQLKDGVISKLPDFVKSKIHESNVLENWKGEYETINTKFAMSDGVFNITEINGKAYPNKGMDLKGNGNLHLSDYNLEMKLDLIDTYNMLNADDFAKDDHYGHFALSPHVTGTLFSPHFDWADTIGKLAQNAAKQQAKQTLQKAIGNQLPANLPQGAGNMLKGLFGH